GQAQALQPRSCPSLAHKPRQRVAALAVTEAPEVDPRQHHLAMTLLDPLPDLPQNRVRTTAARGSADERNHAEPAREAAPVLDTHERTHAVEPRVGLNASDRADVPRDERRRLLRPTRDDGHVVGQAVERLLEVGPAAGHVPPTMGS